MVLEIFLLTKISVDLINFGPINLKPRNNSRLKN